MATDVMSKRMPRTRDALSREYAEEYAWGTYIDFSLKGNAPKYQREGWSRPEKDFTWTDGHSAVLQMRIERPGCPIRFSLHAFAFMHGRSRPQEVDIYLNFLRIKRISCDSYEEFDIIVPPEVFLGSWLNLTLSLSDAMRPTDLGVGTDERRLGLAVSAVNFLEA